MNPRHRLAVVTCVLAAACTCSDVRSAPREPTPWKIPPKLADAVELPAPAAVRLEGFLGFRVANNAVNRLAKVDEQPLLAGFRQRPGSHPWIGEHVGKWMHAAVLAWSYTGDEDLKAKLDRVAADLVRCQEPDGYLGTYTPDKRFGLFDGADWDVWSHKYNLIGLLTYYQYTGDPAALDCCRRIGDLLLRTFGPGRKSLLAAGTHVGMAATSVLEPMVLLYRATGDGRYLDFAEYIVRSWDEPGGPGIITSLRQTRSVEKTANAKAYEMLSNLVGLCELARATGKAELLEPVLIAWQDIVDHRLYITGGASQGEHFRQDHYLPNHEGAHVSETCVITTWIQLNSQLLRLTGEARFSHELEKTFVNHLTAAQRPDGAEWCYFTPLEGAKPYGPGINCCVSSGPRGLALVPPHAFIRRQTMGQPETLLLNLLEPARAGLNLGGQDVILESVSDAGKPGHVVLTVRTDKPAHFAIGVRTPPWAQPLELATTRSGPKAHLKDGWTILPARAWIEGDTVLLRFTLAGRRIEGEYGNRGRAALAWGPALLAYDEAFNRDLGPCAAIGLAPTTTHPPVTLRMFPDGGAVFEAPVRSRLKPGVHTGTFVLFADAGSQGSRYQVWLRGPSTAFPTDDSRFLGAAESRSLQGNVHGSITDGDPGTFVVTFNGKPQDKAWFAVQSSQPVEFRVLRFSHGRAFHDGGWFDASSRKPHFEIQRQPDGPWEPLAPLASYPATTASQSAGLQDGQSFSVELPSPKRAIGLRIVGTPASGDDPSQAFASCAELEALP